MQSVSGIREQPGSGVHPLLHRLGFVAVKISPSCLPGQRRMEKTLKSLTQSSCSCSVTQCRSDRLSVQFRGHPKQVRVTWTLGCGLGKLRALAWGCRAGTCKGHRAPGLGHHGAGLQLGVVGASGRTQGRSRGGTERWLAVLAEIVRADGPRKRTCELGEEGHRQCWAPAACP